MSKKTPMQKLVACAWRVANKGRFPSEGDLHDLDQRLTEVVIAGKPPTVEERFLKNAVGLYQFHGPVDPAVKSLLGAVELYAMYRAKMHAGEVEKSKPEYWYTQGDMA